MNGGNGMSIGWKLKIGFFVPLLLTIALGVMFLILVEKLSANANTIATVNLVAVRSTSDINTNTSDFRIAELQHILSSDEKDMAHYENEMKKELKTIDDNEKIYEKIIVEKDKPLYVEFKRLWGLYLAESEQVGMLSKKNKDEEAKALSRGESQRLFKDACDILLKLIDQNNIAANESTKEADSLHSIAFYATVIVLGILIIVSLILASTITTAILTPIKGLTDASKKIAAGNLKRNDIPIFANDEVGELTTAFNQMVASLKTMTGQTRSATQNITSATAEILASTQQQAASTQEQAAAVQQTTATVEEINQSGNQVSDRAKQVAASAEAASSTSTAGLQAVLNTNRAMEAIREQAEAVSENIVSLSEKTQTVGEIIATVNDIAEQSNLLALNAAIEAAAAGDHGRRFSVVATELKNLADQSKASTVQVRTILGDIQKGINTSVMLTEETVKRVETGKQQAEVAERTIRQMADSTIASVQAFQQIVAATNQQQIGFEQVTQALKNIRLASQQNAIGTQQMEKAASNLNALGQQLNKSVERYEL